LQISGRVRRADIGRWLLNVNPGVTPFMIGCTRCGSDARSAFYPAFSADMNAGIKLLSTHEWYRPGKCSRIDADHVNQGGLLLRKRTDTPPITHALRTLFKDRWKGCQSITDFYRAENACRADLGMPAAKPLCPAPGMFRPLTKPQPLKIGRNAPCPCGSGAKFKKCCGAGS